VAVQSQVVTKEKHSAEVSEDPELGELLDETATLMKKELLRIIGAKKKVRLVSSSLLRTPPQTAGHQRAHTDCANAAIAGSC
jgi:hypothetical protein